jgi:hypothetical protein
VSGNKFVIPDKYKMSRFQDALSQSSPGDFQSVYDISKAYHHIRLHPDSYSNSLVGFCVEDEDGKERFYMLNMLNMLNMPNMVEAFLPVRIQLHFVNFLNFG